MPVQFPDDSLIESMLTEDEILEVRHGTPERADELWDKAATKAAEKVRDLREDD